MGAVLTLHAEAPLGFEVENFAHELARVAGIRPRSWTGNDRNSGRPNGPVRLIEAKSPDLIRVGELCEQSWARNQWANFGPVCQALARIACFVSGVQSPHTAVMASSATAGLYAAAGVFAAKAGHELRWAISAFGFQSTKTGPFAGRTIPVDCDAEGFLDLAVLETIPDEVWDGLLVTHTFGLKRDLSVYVEFCRKRQKPLIADSAMRFPGPRCLAPNVIEVVSFHHTKPWGFGEGGCIFLDEQDATLASSLLNNGMGLPEFLLAYASNGKLSELAAAAIIDRIELMPRWSREYHAQQRRICTLAAEAEVACLGTFDNVAVPAHVPVLASRPIELRQLPTVGFECGKYYQPLFETCPTAASTYARIINIPCHGDMAFVPDRQIARVLSRIRGAT